MSEEDQEAYEAARLQKYLDRVVKQTGRGEDDAAVHALADLWLERDMCSSSTPRGQLTKELTRQLLIHAKPAQTTVTPSPEEWVALMQATPDLLLQAVLGAPELLGDKRLRDAVG